MNKPHATPNIRMRSCCMWAAGAFISLLALPLPLQASNNDSKASQTQQKDGEEKDRGAPSSNDRNDNRAASADKPTDLQSCKQDADGKKGPERSRFMTACLRERK